MDSKKYIKWDNENSTYQNLWDTASTACGRKFKPSDNYSRAEHELKIKNWEKKQSNNNLGGRK